MSLENGLILCYDARTLSSSSNPKSTPPRPKYTISAHDGPATALDINPHMRGCIATGGLDSKLKIWNVNEEVEGRREVSLVTSRDLGVVSFELFLFLFFFRSQRWPFCIGVC